MSIQAISQLSAWDQPVDFRCKLLASSVLPSQACLPLGPSGPSSSHRRTPELVLQKSPASFRITFWPPGAEDRGRNLARGIILNRAYELAKKTHVSPCAGVQTTHAWLFFLNFQSRAATVRRLVCGRSPSSIFARHHSSHHWSCSRME